MVGMANGQILSILIELSAYYTSVFSFTDDNFSKYQGVFTKLGMCIDIIEIWFGIADGQISSILSAGNTSIFHFRLIS